MKVLDRLNYYKATITGVVDGDTYDAVVEVFPIGLLHRCRIRLLGCDTPETKGETREKGLEAKRYVQSLFAENAEVVVRVEKADNFGRALADVWFRAVTSGEMAFLADHLIDSELAEPYVGPMSLEAVPLD